MAKKVLKRTRKEATQLLGLGVTTSVGSLALGQMGGTGAASAQAGLGAVSGFMPVMGVAIGGRAALDLTRSLAPEKKRKRGRNI